MGCGDGRDDRVRRGQDSRTRPEIRVERERRSGRAVLGCKAVLELEQVEEARPAPRVDALVGITHRRHGKAGSEDPRDEGSLSNVRVLVLVQQDRVEPGSIIRGHLGEPIHHVEGERDLVPEVDHAELSLQILEPLDGLGELDPLLRRSVGGVAAMLAERLQSLTTEGDDLVGAAPVIGRLVGEAQDLVDHRRLPLRVHEFERHLVEHARTQLGALGRGHHPLPRLDACEQAVPFEHLRRERVIAEHGRLLAVGEIEGPQRAPNLEGQMFCGLIGEGETQHVPGEDTVVRAVRKAPRRREGEEHHPGSDHRRLAGACAGHNHVGPQRHRDGPPLLGRWLRSHGLADLRRTGAIRDRHDAVSTRSTDWGNNSLPSGQRGQRDLKSQYRHWARGSGR